MSFNGGFTKPIIYSGPGAIIRQFVLSAGELGLDNLTPTVINSGSYTTIASYSYSPIYSNSDIIVEYASVYNVGGGLGDAFRTRIAIGATEITFGRQIWTNGAGGGTRSGTLFPLIGKYTNTDLTAKTFVVSGKQDGSDDIVTVYNDAGTWMRITELLR
jgi:hypothetical protein